MVMCWLVSEVIRGSVDGTVPDRIEPQIVFHFEFQVDDWIKEHPYVYLFDIREIPCEGF